MGFLFPCLFRLACRAFEKVAGAHDTACGGAACLLYGAGGFPVRVRGAGSPLPGLAGFFTVRLFERRAHGFHTAGIGCPGAGFSLM